VVVPVKRLALAKSRLAAHGDVQRAALALAFATDVVATALACPGVQRVLVVTDDGTAGRVLRALGATVVPDQPDAGLDAALVHGAAVLRSRDRALSVVALSADLPSARPEHLRAALDAVPPAGRAFVPDAAGSGTTLLAARAPAELRPAYGTGSRARHLGSGAVELDGAPGLRRDVDTPADLAEALLLGVGPRTAAVAAQLTEA
jgi:2-phospho-L-lactate guanylyltransferase